MATETNRVTASKSQSRSDIYWSVPAGDDGIIRWAGYDDGYWWAHASKRGEWRERVGKVTGRRFTLNPETDEVTVAPRVPA